ncbi:Tyrosine-protein phosphatase Lar [Trichoplax sp. H2]|nr:Tyrosine-protein phosphatase Lar [Trichoplax sp. H2]|eukprot:RDD42228.1 Tyrosine-protein phosphatase Lar [Trichoplax sp. H2]
MNRYLLLTLLSCLFVMVVPNDIDIRKGAILKITETKIINSTTVILEWRLNITKEAKYKIAKFIIMIRQSHSSSARNTVLPGSKRSYVVTSLKPRTKYTISVIAYDFALRRKLTVKVITKMPSQERTQNMKNIRISFKNRTSMEIRWKFFNNPSTSKQSIYRIEWYLVSNLMKVGEVKVKKIQKYLISNLKASSSYLIHVTLLNATADNPRLTIVGTTASLIPGKPNMTLEVYGQSSIIVRWQSPKNVHVDTVTKYQISILYNNTGNVYHLPPDFKFHYFSNLGKSGKYTIKLAAKTSAGWGKSASQEVFINVSTSNKETTPINPIEKQNIKATSIKTATTTTTALLPTKQSQRSTTIAKNSDDQATYNQFNLSIDNIMPNSIILNWRYPNLSSESKFDHYEISLAASSKDANSNLRKQSIRKLLMVNITSCRITKLLPFTTYHGHIAVIMNDSRILQSDIQFTTEKLAPVAVEKIHVLKLKFLPNQNQSYQVLVQIPKVSEAYGPISYYDLIIIKLIVVGRDKKLLPVYNLEDLNPQFLNRLLGIQFRHIDLPAYVTARFSPQELPINFTIGDNTTSNGIYNRPLLSNIKYAAILRAYVKTNQVKDSLLYTSSHMVQLPGIEDSLELELQVIISLPIIIIAGSALLTVVLIVLVAVIVRKFYKNKHPVAVRRIHNKTSSQRNLKTIVKYPVKANIQSDYTETEDKNDKTNKTLFENTIRNPKTENKPANSCNIESDMSNNEAQLRPHNCSVHYPNSISIDQTRESSQEKPSQDSEPQLRIITCKYPTDEKIPSNTFDQDHESGYVGLDYDDSMCHSCSHIDIGNDEQEETDSLKYQYQVKDDVRDSISLYQMRRQLSQHDRSSFWI